jgi:glycosyltransferase involved in cell wall biosynthesis
MSICFFRRRANGFFFSIEELFQSIQNEIKQTVSIEDCEMPYDNSGIINKFKNCFFAYANKGSVNHITGDIHYLAIVLPKKNTILTIHDCGEIAKHSGIKKFVLWFFWYYWPVKRLKYITVISETTKVNLLKHVKTNPQKIHVIPNCLIGDYSIKEESFNKKCPRILLVGVTPNKNLDRIFEALVNVPCKVILLGNPTKAQLKLLQKFDLFYEVHGGLTREKVIELYSSSDMLLYPSLLEGFGLPIIEAQASGIPVITSNINPMPQTAGKDGAIFINPFEVTEIREAVLQLIEDDVYKEKLIAGGLLNIKRFTPATIAVQYRNLYDEINKLNSLLCVE